MSDNDRYQMRHNLNQAFGPEDTSPAYSAWAKMQQRELDQRKGDGYSPWEHLAESLKGAPEMARRQFTDWAYGDGQQTGPQDRLLESMRKLSEKQRDPNYQLNRHERQDQLNWQQLLEKGKTPQGY